MIDRDFVGHARTVPLDRWPDGSLVAVNIVVNVEEGAEAAWPDGEGNDSWGEYGLPIDPAVRDLGTEGHFEFGSRVGIWRMLNLFEAHDMPITCYAVGQALEKNPAVVTALTEGGHEIANHAYRWLDYHSMPPDLEKEYIERQLKVMKELTGEYPGGWYYGRLSPRSKTLVHEVYREHGIQLAWESDSYCDDLPYWVDVPAEKDEEKPEGMLMIPYT